MFPDIQWGEYQLIIGCGDDSVCSTLSQWIHFPEPVSVSAHPSYSQLAERIVNLEAKLAAAVKNTVPPTIPSEAPPKPPVSEGDTDPPVNADPPETTPSIYITTHYLEYAVGGLIAVLVCGLLAYLIYHYRTMVGLVPS